MSIFKRAYRMLRKRKGFYSTVTCSDEEIRAQAYKKFIGGGEESWESKGRFQLHLLRCLGLQPHHRMLDVGCGPIRAGAHLMTYLDPGRYHGVDYNGDFIRAARDIVARDPRLVKREPRLSRIDDFDFTTIGNRYDVVLAFSVLNHCSDEQRGLFFRRLPSVLDVAAKVYVTHTGWFKGMAPSVKRLRVTRRFLEPNDISPDIRLDEWGWSVGNRVFPILELMPIAEGD